MTNKISNSDSSKPTIAFVATKEIQDALTKYSEEQERSISWIIRKALEQYLNIPSKKSTK